MRIENSAALMVVQDGFTVIIGLCRRGILILMPQFRTVWCVHLQQEDSRATDGRQAQDAIPRTDEMLAP